MKIAPVALCFTAALCLSLAAGTMGCAAVAQYEEASQAFDDYQTQTTQRAATSWEQGNASYDAFMAKPSPELASWDAAHAWTQESVNAIGKTDQIYADAQMHGSAEQAYLTHFKLAKMPSSSSVRCSPPKRDLKRRMRSLFSNSSSHTRARR